MKYAISILMLFTLALVNAQKASEKIDTLAEKVLHYQLANGAWPKQLSDKSVVNYGLPLTPDLLNTIKSTGTKHATIDNKATSREIDILMNAYSKTKKKTYLQAAEKGIDYLLTAQYNNGGFPQYYPDSSLYRGQITLNDNAMVNALAILDATATGSGSYKEVQNSLKKRAADAVEKGISCLLSLQVKQNDTLTIWAAQYDHHTLTPAQARSFEPASLSTAESVNVVRFLMKQPYSDQIRQSVDAAVRWFATHDIEGYRFEHIKNSQGDDVRELIPDSTSIIWSRFYDLQNNKPIFGDRDNSTTYNFQDVSNERKNGYAWFVDSPRKLVEIDYAKWVKKNTKK
ncbi:pectate lyase [Sphingobacterium sp. LRF_L2]|uniref:pectate lyase n=1 Tax=Sphingobacterium sp. LRF_L2 TaxID=3369421 RepID=UPI003F645F2C